MTPAGGPGDFKDEVLRQFTILRDDIERLAAHLDRHKDRINAELNDLRVESATLKTRLSFMAGLYGVVGGAIAAFVTVLLRYTKP